MDLKNNTNLKATIAFAISSFATSGINYLTTPIFTRLISVEEYGVISLYNSFYAIISVIATLTLTRPGILNVGMHEHKDNRWQFLSTMLGLVSLAAVVTAAVVFFLWPFLSTIVNIPKSLVVLIFLTCLFQPAITLWTVKERFEYNYKIVVPVTVISAIVAQLFSIGAVCYFKNSDLNLAEVRLWSAGLINICTACVVYIMIVIKGKCLWNKQIWKITLAFAIPLIPHYLGFSLLTGSDKIMIDVMVGSDKTGIYSLAAVISNIGALVWSALCVSFTPFVLARIGEKDYKAINESIRPLLLLVGIVCFLISLLAPEILLIFGKRDYLEGINVVPPIAAGLFMHVYYDIFSNVSFFYKKSVKIMIATLFAALLNVLLNYFGIIKFGYLAAGYTTLISYYCLALLHYLNSIRIEKKNVFDFRFFIISSLIVIILCISCIFLYKSIIIRYLISFGLMIFIVLKRKVFIDCISNMRI